MAVGGADHATSLLRENYNNSLKNLQAITTALGANKDVHLTRDSAARNRVRLRVLSRINQAV